MNWRLTDNKPAQCTSILLSIVAVFNRTVFQMFIEFSLSFRLFYAPCFTFSGMISSAQQKNGMSVMLMFHDFPFSRRIEIIIYIENSQNTGKFENVFSLRVLLALYSLIHRRSWLSTNSFPLQLLLRLSFPYTYHSRFCNQFTQD